MNALRLILAVIATALGALAFSAAPALAVGPTLAAEAATSVTASSADLQATVNPEGVPLTSCTFEYGTEAGVYPSKADCEQTPAQIGEGTQPVLVSAAIGGLQADTEYHWRLSATNAAGTATSVDHTLVYQTTGETLPDNRAYEMVSPPFKNGASLGDVIADTAPQISEDGSRVTIPSIQCFAASESCTGLRATSGEPFAFTRTGEGQPCGSRPPCWVTTAFAPPAAQFSENTFFKASATGGTALFSMPSGLEGEDEWYARQSGGSFRPIGPTTPPGRTGIQTFRHHPRLGTADLSHIVWQLEAPLWPFDKTAGRGGAGSLYEYVGTGNRQPFLVGVSTKGQPKPNAEPDLISTCGTGLSEEGNQGNNALSADGRTVYFRVFGGEGCFGAGANKAIPVPADELYARVDGELEDAHTVAVSQPDCKQVVKCKEAEASPSDANFASASEDGSKVFFTDTQMLTGGATEGTGRASVLTCPDAGTECNLYEYDLNEPAGQNLIDVSAGDTSGLGPRVQGVVASSADGSHVYFVANGVLASGAEPGDCNSLVRVGSCNLYVYERDASYPAGHTAFIARVPISDHELLGWFGPAENVTPDGRFLVFGSHGDLTSDVTRTDGAVQIFRYDAQTGKLVRVSVGNDGFSDNGNAGTGDATIVTANLTSQSDRLGAARGDPTMSDDGSYVFFQSPIALTPHALDDLVIGHVVESVKTIYAQNVYEWHAGHVYLISDGRDTTNAGTPCASGIGARVDTETEVFGSAVCLLGTDAEGSNVLFTTADGLVPRDTDTQIDVYDARICEPEQGNSCVTEPPPPLPACGGEACHGIPPAIPSGVTPGTATFNGQGNVSPPPPTVVKPKPVTNAQKLAKALASCRKKYKHSKKRRGVCEKQAHRAYRATAKTVTNHGRTK